MNRFLFTGLTCLMSCALIPGTSRGAPQVRVQVDQRGDSVLIGNALGHECVAGTPAPILGTVNCGGTGTGDTAPDIFWSADSPGVGQAEANVSVTTAQARSTAVLNIPAGAYVTHAYVYWGARRAQAGADTSATIAREGVFSTSIDAVDSKSVSILANNYYQSVADVTSLVRTHGSGAYRMGDVDVAPLANVNNSNSFAGWWMAVFYELPSEPPRNLTLLDGLDSVTPAAPAIVSLTNFISPMVGIDGKLGVVAYEGDQLIADDHLFFGDNVDLFDTLNSEDNFFNGTRSFLGVPVSNAGDLPWLTGTPQSLANFDIDVVDVASKLTAGQNTAEIQATSTGDDFFLGGFVTSLATQAPIFATTSKTVTDVNGGALLPGDELEYTIVVSNSGNDVATGVVLTDDLPNGVSYKAGSIKVTTGPNMGDKTDLPLDDQADFNNVNQMVTVRLGTGANGLSAGELAIDEGTTVVFRVTVNADATGEIINQAEVTAAGQLGAAEQTTPTDSDTNTPGSQPTVVIIDECGADADCPAAEPRCNTAPTPNVCVECLADADCTGLEPTCDLPTNTCTCVPSGAEVCDGKDNDCNGQIDEGLTGGAACMTNLPGLCATGTTACTGGMEQCTPDVQPGDQPEECGNNVDEDCDGQINNGCVDGDMDGIPTVTEEIIGTDPNDADSDDDGVPDGEEQQPGEDADDDGLINGLDPDSDNDGLFDGTELGLDCSNPATNAAAGNCVADADTGTTKTDPYDADTDNGGVKDGAEDSNLNGAVDAGETNPTQGNGGDDNDAQNTDSDGDGLTDKVETTLGSNPNDADSDDDGVVDGQEPNPASDTDGDGPINVLDVDSDNDGLYDGTELGLDCSDPATDASKGHCIADEDNGLTTTSPIDPDSDDGGVSDGSEDVNGNGAVDTGDSNPTDGNGLDDSVVNTDADGDGLSDGFEMAIGTDPNDADSDDDGVIDGREPNPADDTDGDGVTNALDVDSDNDGLLDGTELGYDCSNPATSQAAGTCIADADGGATKTSPINPDTDGGGASDGSEDTNLNGVIDGSETNPTKGQGGDDSGVTDTDGDGLSDALETAIGTNPNDADSDDDGVIDGREPNPTVDTDGDGLINVLDVDSDNDALFDGTELGLGCDDPATSVVATHCIPDGDMGATKTSPIDPDTDNGGAGDGSEDSNLNGVVDGGETDPTNGNGADDVGVTDTDGDGLGDAVEGTLGSNPNDADSDDDGVVDGKEPNPSDDLDGDGKPNIADEDSDNDGLFDGTELGLGCDEPATSNEANHCIPDGDNGATTTSPLDPDTDNGGVKDGGEDTNHNGEVDAGEKDPNNPVDDMGVLPCAQDSVCGGPNDGFVCDTSTGLCVEGCKNVSGAGCPVGLFCILPEDGTEIGHCGESPTASGGGSSIDDYIEYDGCICGVPSGAPARDLSWTLLATAAALAARRRRPMP